MDVHEWTPHLAVYFSKLANSSRYSQVNTKESKTAAFLLALKIWTRGRDVFSWGRVAMY